MRNLIVRIQLPDLLNFEDIEDALVDAIDPAGEFQGVEVVLQKPVTINGRFEGFVDS